MTSAGFFPPEVYGVMAFFPIVRYLMSAGLFLSIFYKDFRNIGIGKNPNLGETRQLQLKSPKISGYYIIMLHKKEN